MRQGRPSTAAYVKINVYIDCNRWSENSHCLLDCLFMTFGELVNIALQFYDSFKPDQRQGCGNAGHEKTAAQAKFSHTAAVQFLLSKQISVCPGADQGQYQNI